MIVHSHFFFAKGIFCAKHFSVFDLLATSLSRRTAFGWFMIGPMDTFSRKGIVNQM